uniref:Uncharacterized protein n=1 Tax=Eutreptiella gymnastica TaxID=73025 RepID=A0A7S1IEA3_9EUGL|mmetsp:Transcript_151111/g.264053  ORF Transcript_151111/g.264053 Transcript_151111/m.264053 type:complete len:102 (+) Transcript_151111:251-556(+)
MCQPARGHPLPSPAPPGPAVDQVHQQPSPHTPFLSPPPDFVFELSSFGSCGVWQTRILLSLHRRPKGPYGTRTPSSVPGPTPIRQTPTHGSTRPVGALVPP